MIHFVIHDLDGQSAAFLRFGIHTIRVAAIERCRACLFVGNDIASRLNRRTAPRAGRELGGRRSANIVSITRVANRSPAVLKCVRRGLRAHPESKRKRFDAPCIGMLLPLRLHRTEKRRRTLKLLNCQKPQRVAHDHGKPPARIVASQVALKAANCHRKRRHAKIGFGLTTARREPEKIRVSLKRACTILVCRIDQRRNREKQERQLERTPFMILDLVLDFRQIGGLLLATLKRIDGMHTLVSHHVVCKGKSLTRLGISLQNVDALAEPLEDFCAPSEIGFGLMPEEIKFRGFRLGSLFVDPLAVVIDKLHQHPGINIGRCRRGHVRRDCPHIKLVVRGDVLQGRTVIRALARHFRSWHLIVWNRRCADFNGLLVILRRGNSVDGRVVSDREFYLLTIDHVESLQLLIILREIL